MDIAELKALLSKRLHMELELFKDSKLRQGKVEIFQASYEIEIYVNLYEIFLTHIANLGEDAVRRLLGLNFGILEFVYRGWLSREDGFYDELRSYACEELQKISG